MSKMIIAFAGAKGSGKSTAAALIKSLTTTPINELAFADHLKQVCSEVFNIPLAYFINPKLKEKELNTYINLNTTNIQQILNKFELFNINYDLLIRKHIGQVLDTPRKVLQYVGTNLLNSIDPLVHVNFTLSKLDLTKLNLITDLRFPQEFDTLIQREDFLPIYIANAAAETQASYDLHPSEHGWQTFKDKCIYLDNNSTIANLTQNLTKVVEAYKL